MNATEMEYFRGIVTITEFYRIRNEIIGTELRQGPLLYTMTNKQLNWYKHFRRMGKSRLVERVYNAKRRRNIRKTEENIGP